MKNLFLVIALAFSAVVLNAQDQETTTTPAANENGPVMVFETKTVDYGTIEQGSDPLRLFKFTNTGTEPLIIKNAKGSCGCTVPKWPKKPILPGESNEIEVRYDTKRIGKFTKRVTLTTNETNSTTTLTIKGEVKPKPAEPEAVPSGQQNFLNGNN